MLLPKFSSTESTIGQKHTVYPLLLQCSASAATVEKDTCMYATPLSQYQNWPDGRSWQRCTKSNAHSTYILLPTLRVFLEAVDESRCGKHVTVKRCANNSSNETQAEQRKEALQ